MLTTGFLHLQVKGENGLSSGVVLHRKKCFNACKLNSNALNYLEFIPVVPVFPQSPHCHLVGSGQGEDTSRQTLGHQAETYPRSNLKGRKSLKNTRYSHKQLRPGRNLPRKCNWDMRPG